ncbi:MAG: LamG domain-containing protein [Planctomycetota bacterium]|jgi:hypothetical protein
MLLSVCFLVVMGLQGSAVGRTILYISFDGSAGLDIPSPLVSDIGGMEFLPADSSPSYDAESNLHYNSNGTSGLFEGPGADEGLYRADPGPDDPLDLQNLEAFTIEAFVKATTLEDRNIVIRKYLEYWLSLRGDGAVDFYQGDGVGGGGAGEATCNAPAGTVTAGQWHHIAVVFDRSSDPNTVMYVDGVEVATGGRADWGYPDVGDHFAIGVMKRTYNNSRARHFTGLIDELRISDTALSPPEFLLAGGASVSNPSPESGAGDLCDGASLCWTPGCYAQEVDGHDIYLGTDFDDVNDAGTNSAVYQGSQNRDANCYTTSGLASGTVYYWRVDEVNDAEGDSSPWKGAIWQFTTNDGTAFGPNPEDGQTLVDLDTVLTWSAGCTADSHDVYLGTDSDDVENADTNTSEIFKGNHGTAEYDPCDLDYATWYYWRIDEVDGGTRYKGDVWSFKSKSAITDVNFVAWYKFDETDGAIAYDSSGYEQDAYVAADEIYWDPNDGHDGGSLIFNDETAVHLPDGFSGVLGKLADAITISLWLKDARRGSNNWVFEAVNGDYRVHAAVDSSDEDILWRAGNDSNDVLRWDLDGQNVDDLEGWHHWAFVKDEVAGEMGIYFDGILVDSNAIVNNTLTNLRGKKMKIGTGDDQAEILQAKADDFRIHDRALTELEVAELYRGDDIARAWAPVPRDNTQDVPRDVGTLSWRPGSFVVQHKVFFGESWEDVNDMTDPCATKNLGDESYDPGMLELETTYYWRIDEVNGPNTWKGNVWSFRVANFLIVDDAESYNAIPGSGNEVFDTWDDGFMNWTGSQIALEYSGGTTHGGGQSMKVQYDNAIAYYKYSEVDANTTGPRPGNLDIGVDWTILGVQALTVFFYGTPGNDANEQMYVALEDGSSNIYVSNYGALGEDMNDIREAEWHQWDMALSDFEDNGVVLTDVSKVRIGFGDRDNPAVGGLGIVFFDDIRLYLPKCVPWLAKPVYDFSNDCIVNLTDLRIMAQDWLLSDIDVAPVTAPSAAVLHYAFEDTSGSSVTDSAGSYTGTFFTDMTTAPADISPRVDAGGKSGNSFHFSSPLGYGGIKMPSTVFTDNGISQEITISVWVKNAYSDEDPDGGAFMWEFRQWDMVSEDANDRVLAVETQDNGDTYVFHDQNESVSYEMDWERHTGWKHYAFVRNDSNLAIYVNGVLESISDSNGTALATPQLLYLGISADRSPTSTEDMHDGFTGNVDEWKVFDYALSSAEVGHIASDGTGVVLIDSAYNIYDTESAGSRAINFRDYSELMDSWLEEILWPQ